MTKKIALKWYSYWKKLGEEKPYIPFVELSSEVEKLLWGMDRDTYIEKNGVDYFHARESEALSLISQRCKWDIVLALDEWTLVDGNDYSAYNSSTLEAFWYQIIDMSWKNFQEVSSMVENLMNVLHIVLAGGQGVWKSTTWIILSELISILSTYFPESRIGDMFWESWWNFIDVDQEIVKRELNWEKIKDFQTRKSEEWEDWEKSFRPKEANVWSNLVNFRKPLIIATGWWTLTFENNREIVSGNEVINSKAIVVYLWADVKTRMNRIMWDKEGNKNRGTIVQNSEWLSGWDAKELELKTLAPTREPLMYDIADIVIDTRDKPPAEVAMEIIELINA